METGKNGLFNNISESEQLSMMNCFNTCEKNYAPGEIICFFDDDNMCVGIVEEGNACVVHSLPNGSRTILEYLTSGDIFGQLFYFHGMRENITVEASSKCKIRFIDYEHIIKRCTKACACHSRLVSNILIMISDKTKKICQHLEVLSQRSIRDKLMCYFEILSEINHSKTFEIPFTMSFLADYLSVDRSAMSRELGKMRDEGLLRITHRKITLS